MEGLKMAKHTHEFVETFNGFLGFGLDRQGNVDTLKYYLQKFSDDQLMDIVLERMTDSELDDLFNMIGTIMKKYLAEPEYHIFFLKDEE
jgi:hypothetical protein